MSGSEQIEIEELAEVPGRGAPARAEHRWHVERATGTVQQLHDAELGLERRLVRIHRPLRAAVVLGSTQSDTLVDGAAARAAGVEVARRRSGGGAVYLSPDSQVWVDVVVPAGDPLWQVDVERASWWLGTAWASALARSGSPTVHRSGVSDRRLGRIACFAAMGPGEVELGGRKVVGLSQRRTRLGARFQCVAYTRWDPERLLSLLDLHDESAAVAVALRTRAGAVSRIEGDPLDQEWSVVEDFLRSLP